MDGTRAIAVCLAALSILVGTAASAGARPEGASEAELDAMSTEDLERELIAIERELALVHRERFTLAMRARDRRAAGLALSAWRTHQAMAQELVPEVTRDARLSARVALHAHALAIEGRAPRGLAVDVGALDRELAALTRALG